MNTLNNDIERKIKEMELSSQKSSTALGPTKSHPTVPISEKDRGVYERKDKAVSERKLVLKRNPEQEKAAYGKTFAGTSRLRLYTKEDKLGEGTFG